MTATLAFNGLTLLISGHPRYFNALLFILMLYFQWCPPGFHFYKNTMQRKCIVYTQLSYLLTFGDCNFSILIK